ncbi:hypothetical protein MKL09_08535 [Methylobacterium sp. J-048]|uniref:hypothetical protein n=1 Tax=Methylobacterium sp. J-048 TaxID=2836635 RepID=UPI001FB98046|nr:hypothetical protein [Methylobacterium sp. J-048]MCJ2056600.1 hypothetical protein [Methylobacterium sp. J-048]
MAIQHPTPPFGGGERPRLPSAQVGPVTQALRACRPVDPADLAIADIQIGLASFFADADRQRVRELRRRIADRIEADLDLLDALDGDADREADYASCEHHPSGGLCTLGRSTDDEESLCGIGTHPGGSLNLWPSHDDREAGDDNGIADWQGESEQRARHLTLVAGGCL